MRRALVALALTAVLTACNKAAPDSVDDTALIAINDAVAAELNAAPAAIVQTLKALDKPTPIALDAMQITLDQKPVPIDWWLVQHGYVEPIVPPPSPDRPTFLVSTAGRTLAAQVPNWFTAAAATPDQVDCHGVDATTAGGCLVQLTVAAQLDEGAPRGAGAAIDPIKIDAVLMREGDNWRVGDLRLQSGNLHDIALDALLGKAQVRGVARQQALANLNLATPMSAPDTRATAVAASAPDVPLPPTDLSPVTPVIGDNPYAARRIPGAR